MSPWLLLTVTVSQTFFVFDGLDSFEAYWSGVLQYVLWLGFVCFAHYYTGFMHLGK